MNAAVEAAFNLLTALHARAATIERPGDFGPLNIKISPSNYFRVTGVVEDVSVSGREFVISKANLIAGGMPGPNHRPKKGDRLETAEIGLLMISEVREMYNLGGAIIGYRVRTN